MLKRSHFNCFPHCRCIPTVFLFQMMLLNSFRAIVASSVFSSSLQPIETAAKKVCLEPYKQDRSHLMAASPYGKKIARSLKLSELRALASPQGPALRSTYPEAGLNMWLCQAPVVHKAIQQNMRD